MTTLDNRRYALGGSNYVASARLSGALDTVVGKLAKQMNDGRGRYESEHPDPSADELANVRRRFLEWQAIEHELRGEEKDAGRLFARS